MSSDPLVPADIMRRRPCRECPFVTGGPILSDGRYGMILNRLKGGDIEECSTDPKLRECAGATLLFLRNGLTTSTTDLAERLGWSAKRFLARNANINVRPWAMIAPQVKPTLECAVGEATCLGVGNAVHRCADCGEAVCRGCMVFDVCTICYDGAAFLAGEGGILTPLGGGGAPRLPERKPATDPLKFVGATEPPRVAPRRRVRV